MKKINFENFKSPGISKEILMALQDNIEEAINESDTEVINLLVASSEGKKSLSNNYTNFKKIILKIRNREERPKTAFITLITSTISTGEIYVVSAFQDTDYNMSASIRFINEGEVEIMEIKNVGWSFSDVVIDGIN